MTRSPTSSTLAVAKFIASDAFDTIHFYGEEKKLLGSMPPVIEMHGPIVSITEALGKPDYRDWVLEEIEIAQPEAVDWRAVQDLANAELEAELSRNPALASTYRIIQSITLS